MTFRTCELCVHYHVTPAYRGFCHCRRPRGSRAVEKHPDDTCKKWEARDIDQLRLVEAAEKALGGIP